MDIKCVPKHIEIGSKSFISGNFVDLDQINRVKIFKVFCFITHILLQWKTDIIFNYLTLKSIWKVLGAFLGSQIFM